MKPKTSKHATTGLLLILSQKHLTGDTLSSIKVTVDFGVRIFRLGNYYVILLRDEEYDAGFWPADLRQIPGRQPSGLMRKANDAPLSQFS